MKPSIFTIFEATNNQWKSNIVQMKAHHANMVRNFIILLLIAMVIGLIISIRKNSREGDQVIVQMSTIDALMTGNYDGTISLSDLSGSGDFGIGTFHRLDGEMVLYDGIFYQVKSDGKIYHPENTLTTPYATVTHFKPEAGFAVGPSSFTGLKSLIDSLMGSPNLFFAIDLKGTFRLVRTRSVPVQQKPYPPLVEVSARQPEFEATNVKGLLMGFYCPPYVTGINVPGYHFHFLSDDKTFGGHILQVEIEEGVLRLDQINQIKVMLPGEGSFLEANLKEDLSHDLRKVEGY
jgi:acetolactate decarboxylase